MKPAVTVIPARSTAKEKRKTLNRAQALFLAVRQKGICGCGCGKELDPLIESVIDEHVIALDLGGTYDLSNRALLRKPCAAAKTSTERKPMAKGRRLRGETCNGPKRPINSRGFDKTRRRKMNGTVVPAPNERG